MAVSTSAPLSARRTVIRTPGKGRRVSPWRRYTVPATSLAEADTVNNTKIRVNRIATKLLRHNSAVIGTGTKVLVGHGKTPESKAVLKVGRWYHGSARH